jgi:peptide-methionine (S)-S-oxide reductase
MNNETQKIIFAAGCFWGVEAAFRKWIDKGAVSTRVGYMGGHIENPTYEDVVHQKSGHAQVVEIEYNLEQLSFEQLLDRFWKIHDPTSLNKQGNDIGSDYRSAIFYFTEEQILATQKSIEELQSSGKYDKPIVTEVAPAGVFYEAEPEHQKYLDKNPSGYCHIDLSDLE